MKKTLQLLLSAIVVLALAQPTLAELPIYKLPDGKGVMHDQKELEGKWVVIDFWATWCTTCRNVVKSLQEVRKDIPESKLSIVSINIDKTNPAKVEKFVKAEKMDWLVLLDPANSLAGPLSFEAIPAVFLFSPKGELVASMKGYDADKEKEFIALIRSKVSAN